MRDITTAEVEESRRRLGLDDSWVWYPCENNCGDIGWHPGDILAVVGEEGGPMPLKVCSAKCATELMHRLPPP